MANLPETPDYADGIYQIETTDPVLGGPAGIANRQASQLGGRTAWLKNKIDDLLSGSLAVFKANRLSTARTLSVTGAGSGSTTFDGSANASIALTLADSSVSAGTYPKVTVNAKGLVTAGAALAPADIPALDWSKITSGKPTTLAGYGIVLADSGVTAGTYPKVTVNAKGDVTAGAALAATDIPALDWSKITTGKPTSLDGYGIVLADSGVTAGTYPKVTVNAKGDVTAGAALAAADIPALDWSKITSGKPTTLAGYGIVLADSGVVAGTYPKVTVNAKGDVTAGAALAPADIPALDWSKITSGKPTTLAGYGIVLADSGVVAGTYPKVAVNAKGTVTAGAALAAADIPALDWSKITSGKPTTLAGYGIVLADSGVAAGTYPKVTVNAKGTVIAGAALSAADIPTNLALSGVPTAATAAAGTTNNQVATTEFAQAAVGAGAICAFARNTPPPGWLKANGAAVSRSSYTYLFNAIGTTFGAGNGSTTFNLPDLRGEFIRGWDDGRSVDASRAFGTIQGDTFKGHNHASAIYPSMGNFQYFADVGTTGNYGLAPGNNVQSNAIFNNGGGGTETRPRNVALLICIKY
ncbi:phage tail protein [Pseudomonas sp. 5P_3.1_Bac2]|uniref:phage tail protein n=1 Tax=Pseudomonas sp. 5P_3.1_Bac2 TaxID=2971617 RepID=UPI0021C5CC4E|nr:phage tail protein [Pseudomonas sp. 5P_3.1_Bac2]MCU1718679.1 tail fiber protein [Pseudomonas sp. 5P_3.1_Bac2]